MSTTATKPTTKQLDYAESLLERAGYTTPEQVRERIGVSEQTARRKGWTSRAALRQLDRRDISDLIDELKED